MQYLIAQLTQIGSRLNQYLLLKRMPVDTLAREAAVSSALITNILNGGSYDFIFFLKVINLLPDLNIYWVFTGQGEMLLPVGQQQVAGRPATATGGPAGSRREPKLAASLEEISQLRKQLEEKNALIRRLKQTLSPVQSILRDLD